MSRCVLFCAAVHILLKGGNVMLTWELIGAVVGAGLASGREIASFFSQYAAWSLAGIVLAVLTLVFLSDAALPGIWKSGWSKRLWRSLLALLLTVTGGAMLSGAGEVAGLTVPISGAYWLGMAGTLLLAWLLAHRTSAGLAWVSRLLLGVLALLIALGLTLPPMHAVHLKEISISSALLRGVTYGGFNAALQAPIMASAAQLPEKTRKRSALCAGGIILMLLLLGNAVLLRHPALLSEEMPFIRMMNSFGAFGYYLGAVSLYLAILSTLTACLRGLGGGVLPVIGVVFVSLLGFTGVVEIAYPMLGGGCFLMLTAAKFTNSFRKPFFSRRDML